MKEQRINSYSGTVTKGAMKRITKAVNLLMMYSKPRQVFNEVLGKEVTHRLSFITLTISSSKEMLTAQEAYKKLLHPFLKWLTRTKGVKTYIWKAELQARGQIHYHITTPSFINWKEIRQKWNRLQAEAGLLDDFYAKYKHTDPNSTDIHEVYKIDDLTSYLIKYLAKSEEDKGQTKGKVWDCSIDLKQAKLPTYELNNEQNAYLEAIDNADALHKKYLDQCSILSIPKIPGWELLCHSFLKQFQSFNPLKEFWTDPG